MWVVKPKPNPAAQLKLFCLPFAGGGSISFRSWANYIPAQIELCAVEIPGRGQRLGETLHRRLLPLVQELAQGIHDELNKPFAIFGHSMGALLGFELTHYLKKQYDLQPVHLFLSGRGAPHLPDRDAPIHQLSEAEFVNEIKKFNGTPKAVLENSELMQLMIPILRADFEVCETYQFIEKPPLPLPLTIFGGLNDPGANREELQAWQKHTTSEFNLRMFPGDHFYLLNQHQTLIQAMLRDILKHVSLSVA